MANTSLDIVGLDFESIKGNLITYLKRSDSPFKDVNFEGSNISQLLDVLSYNTYLNSFYLNMVGSEMFLDTAQLRDTIVSHAKELNYVPRSFTSAGAQVSFEVYPSPPVNSLLIPKGTSFTTKIGSNNYTFSTEDNAIYNSSSNGTVVIDGLNIYEGVYVTETFVFDTSNTTQRFVLSNPTIDTRSITLRVLEDNGATTLSYTKASSFLGLSANSLVYFLQAAENSQYEVLFGDNTIGKKPKSGSVVVAEYRVGSGELPNGAAVFDIDGPIQGQSNISTITTTSVATGGSVAESNESIKFNAPRSYQNQERAVTTSDYENILTQNFPEIQAISAYGGEEAIPPQYGKVYIAVDIKNADGTPQLIKEKYYNFVKPRSPLSIDPVIIDPDFLYVDVTTNVEYNINVTTLKESDIRSLVLSNISSYNVTNLSDFKSTLRYSKFITSIDRSHESILSNATTLVPYKRMIPIRGEPLTTTYDFGYQITSIDTLPTLVNQTDYEHNVSSGPFMHAGKSAYVEDDGVGTLWLVTTQSSTHTRLFEVGTVDYETGLVTLSNFTVDDFDGSYIKLYAHPVKADITSTKNIILQINDNDVTIGVTAVRG